MKYQFLLSLCRRSNSTKLPPRGRCYSSAVPNRLIEVGVSSIPGRKSSGFNEDRFYYEKFAADIHYYSIFDGHNGNFVSQFVSKNLPLIIRKGLDAHRDHLYDSPFTIVEDVLRESYRHCEVVLEETMHMMKDLKRKDMIGSTAVVAILVDNKFLSVANVGDSKAILCRDGLPIELSLEHVPTNHDESRRIKSNGGWIDYNSRLTPLVNGRLTMTRSFGNMLLKPDIVTCEPHVRHETIQELHDSFLVLCSDGITHVMTDEELIRIIGDHEKPSDAASDLTSTAHQYGSHDDATAMVVPLALWECGHRVQGISYSSFRTIVGGRSDG